MGVSGNSVSQNIPIHKKQKGPTKKVLYFALASLVSLLCGTAWFIFFFPGPAGDTGSLFDKFRWQWGIALSDDLMRKGEYAKAADALEKCEDIARTFGDDGRRLEATLVKQVEAYGRNHDASKLECVNNDLVTLANERVFQEFELLMKCLRRWEEPVAGAVQREERAREALAYGERIARCADKLSIRSRSKQETLLKRAIKTFDMLNLREGVYRAKFRLQLAEVLRQQLRLDEQRTILAEAVEHAAKNPETPEGWSLKIQSALLFGVLNSSTGKLDLAREELENALKWSAEHTGKGELYRDCLQATADLYKKYDNKEYAQKAAKYAQEAKEISDKLDADEDKD